MNLTDIELIIRIIGAGILGAIIGVEREFHGKDAGVRTHFIVAVGSALMLIISKYGFATDEADLSRVAANIITGVSFLGAGMIFSRGDKIHGLTTAAGIWATAAIGMAIGNGMYALGIITTAIMLFFQSLLHYIPKKPNKDLMTELEFTVKASLGEDSLGELIAEVSKTGARVHHISTDKREDGLYLCATVTVDEKTKTDLLTNMISDGKN